MVFQDATSDLNWDIQFLQPECSEDTVVMTLLIIDHKSSMFSGSLLRAKDVKTWNYTHWESTFCAELVALLLAVGNCGLCENLSQNVWSFPLAETLHSCCSFIWRFLTIITRIVWWGLGVWRSFGWCKQHFSKTVSACPSLCSNVIWQRWWTSLLQPSVVHLNGCKWGKLQLRMCTQSHAGMVQAWVAHKLLKQYISRDFTMSNFAIGRPILV